MERRNFWQRVFNEPPSNLIYYISLSKKAILSLAEELSPYIKKITIVHSQDSLPIGKSGNVIRNFWGSYIRIMSISQFYRRRHDQYNKEVYIILGLGRNLLEIEYLPDRTQSEWCIFPTPVSLRGKYQENFPQVRQIVQDAVNYTKFSFSKNLLKQASNLSEFVLYLSRKDLKNWKNTFPDARVLGPREKRVESSRILLLEGYEYMLDNPPKIVLDTQQHDFNWMRGKRRDNLFSSSYRRALVNINGGRYFMQYVEEHPREKPPYTELSRAFLVLYLKNTVFLRKYIDELTIDHISSINSRINLLTLPTQYLLLEIPWFCYAFLAMWMRKKLLVTFPAIVTVACLMNNEYLFTRNEETPTMSEFKKETPMGTLLKVWEDSWKHLAVHFNFLRTRRGYEKNLRDWCQQNDVNEKKILNIYRDIFDLAKKTHVDDRNLMKLDDWMENLEFFFSSIMNHYEWRGGEEYASHIPGKNYFLPKPPVGMFSETPQYIVPIQVDAYFQILTAVRYNPDYVENKDTLLDAFLDRDYFRNHIPIVLRAERYLTVNYSLAPRVSVLPSDTYVRTSSGNYLIPSYYDITGEIKPVNR